MQWRPYTRIFARLNHTIPITRPAFTPTSKGHYLLQQRAFHFVDGKFTVSDTPLPSQPQPDWNDEVDDVDVIMVSQELTQLQQFLGLVAPKNGKPVQDVVFVCIDCEAFELDQSKITEIGVSVLDSRAVKHVDAGEDGKPWFDLMQHLHLRPNEYKKLVNRRYVKGCPDGFNFGESAFIPLGDAGKILQRIFSDPSRIHEACDFDKTIADVEPAIMLVGHDLKSDTDYLKKLGFTPSHVAGNFDTQRLARISKKSPPGLAKLLAALSINATNLHNAGNDAAYTLQALVGVAVQEFRLPGNVVKTLIAEKEVNDAAKAVQKAEKEVRRAAMKAQKEAKDAARAAQNAKSQSQSQSQSRKRPTDTAAGAKWLHTTTSSSSKKSTELDALMGGGGVTVGHAAAAAGQPDESRREHKSRVRYVRQAKDE